MKESKWKRESGELSWVFLDVLSIIEIFHQVPLCFPCVCTCKFMCVSIRERERK